MALPLPGPAPGVLERLSQGTSRGQELATDAIKSIIPTIQAIQANRLQLQAAKKKQEKEATISSIIASSFTPEGEFDALGAANRMRKQGINEEAQVLLQQEAKLSESDVRARKILNDMSNDELKMRKTQLTEMGALFGSVLAAKSDTAVINSFNSSVSQGVLSGLLEPNTIPAGLSPKQMKQFSQDLFLQHAKISETIDYIYNDRRLELEAQRLGAAGTKEDGPESLPWIARKMIENQRNKLPALTDLTPTQLRIWDEKYGTDTVKTIGDLLANNLEFQRNMLRNPQGAIRQLLSTAELARTMQQQMQGAQEQQRVSRDDPEMAVRLLIPQVPATDAELKGLGVTREEVARKAVELKLPVSVLVEKLRVFRSKQK